MSEFTFENQNTPYNCENVSFIDKFRLSAAALGLFFHPVGVQVPIFSERH